MCMCTACNLFLQRYCVLFLSLQNTALNFAATVQTSLLCVLLPPVTKFTQQNRDFFLRHKKKEEDKQTDAGFVTPKGARRPQSVLACGGNFLPWLSFVTQSLC